MVVKFTARNLLPRAGSGMCARFTTWIILLSIGPGIQDMMCKEDLGSRDQEAIERN